MMIMSLVLVEPLMLLVAPWPGIENVLTEYINALPYLIVLGLALLIPAVVKYVIAVKNGAPLFSNPKFDYQPWPTHSHPVAKNISWGGVDPENDIKSRQTKIILCGELQVKQTVLLRRKVMLFVVFIAGVVLTTFPFLAKTIVYEITPPRIEGLQKMAQEMTPLFVGPGAIILLSCLFIWMRKIPTALVDKVDGTLRLRQSRFMGLLDCVIKPDEDIVVTSKLVGFQLISYRSKHSYGGSKGRNGSRIEQYELNAVLSDRKRKLISKQPASVSMSGGKSNKALLSDALVLARFLDLPVWDRCGYYRPDSQELLQPADPLIQPL